MSENVDENMLRLAICKTCSLSQVKSWSRCKRDQSKRAVEKAWFHTLYVEVRDLKAIECRSKST